jgi:hypothetical protein
MRNRMHSPKIKILNANLAYCINQYNNTKKKLLICNANIYFNKSCLVYKIVPKYARINIKTSNYFKAVKQTETQTRILRIKNGINFLYKKKIQLNKHLYTLYTRHQTTRPSFISTVLLFDFHIGICYLIYIFMLVLAIDDTFNSIDFTNHQKFLDTNSTDPLEFLMIAYI